LPGGEVEEDVKVLGADGFHGGERVREGDNEAGVRTGDDFGGGQVLLHADVGDVGCGEGGAEVLKRAGEQECVPQCGAAHDPDTLG
jgi:hypothetical protein